MKKRIAMMLTLVMALGLMIPAYAADEMSARARYQEYLDVAEAINQKYGTNVTIIPMDQMDPDNMPTVEEVSQDVEDLAKLTMAMQGTVQQAEEMEQMQRPGNQTNGAGTRYWPVYINVPYDGKTFKFLASGSFTVNTPVGYLSYYFQSVSGQRVIRDTPPNGYTVTATENVRMSLLLDNTKCIMQRSFKITKGAAQSAVTVRGIFTVNRTTGTISSTGEFH